MIVVINAGGSGTRLWPLSTPDYPKHLLTLIGEDSLLQLAYKRAKLLSDNIYIVTEVSHADHVKQQLPELDDNAFIIEPARRGTAGCIIAGLHHVSLHHDDDEAVAFLQADHMIKDSEGFVYSFKLAAEAAVEHKQITLIGIEPTSPSSAFGYIQKAEQLHKNGLLYRVGGFREKPEFGLAQQYMQSGRYLWNCGYFVGSVSTFRNSLEQYAPQWNDYLLKLSATSSVAEYEATYISFESDAIDYALMEKTKELLVVPASFDWMDVGSYGDVYRAVGTDKDGNHISGGNIAVEDVQNTMIMNLEQGKQVGVIGLDNVVVINTPKGLLITRRDLDQKVKSIVAQFAED